MANRPGNAIVIGGSMAGLLAARVLSDHFARVTILERDPVHDRPEARKGQPQTQHVHALLGGGREILMRLFPGIEQALVDGGAIRHDAAATLRWYQFGGYRVPHESGVISLSMTRPFLEWHVRQRVLALPNVTLLAPVAVQSLLTDSGRRTVSGVLVQHRDNGRELESLTADLVVDATGRGSVTPKWLAALGYTPPPEEKVTVRVGYATRAYRRRPGDLAGAEGLFVVGSPEDKRGALLLPVEGDRWLLTVGGLAGNYPPTDEADLLAFVRGLPTADLSNFLNRAEPLSDIVSYRYPANLRRRYEKLKRFPTGFLVLGDALASFNPIYGQGMTSAAMQVQVLDELLRGRKTRSGLWRPFFKRAAKVVDIPWSMATGEDFRLPETEGRKPRGTDLLNAYTFRLHQATHHDPVVYRQFLRVMHMLAPTSSLLHPRILWRVWRASRRPATRPQTAERGRMVLTGRSGD